VKLNDLYIERCRQFKAEIRQLRSEQTPAQFEFSDFGSELQESFEFEIVQSHNLHGATYPDRENSFVAFPRKT
jgi:hypothetical protein